MMTKKEPEYIFKVVAIGSGGVGKTSLIRRYATDKFQESYLMTLGVDFTTKEVNVEDFNTNVKIIMVDTAGQEYYGRLRPTYYTGANGCMLCFDLTDKTSFEKLPDWLTEIMAFIDDKDKVPFALVGNKSDLKQQRKVSAEEAQEFAAKKNMKFFEASAKEGKNVNTIFEHLSYEILKRNIVE
ncbi:MAG: GTP-binding protein [Candidatus Hodarchaeales archaeon]|jgi:Ras-related protein Rab-1A